MVVIFEGEAGRSTGGGETEFVDNLLPEFVMRYCLASTFFADGFIKFKKVKFLASDLRDFDLSNAFGTPIFGEVFLEFAFLF